MRSALLGAVVGASVLLCLGIGCSSGDSTSSATRTAVSTAAGPRHQPAPAQPLDGQVVEPHNGVIELAANHQQFVQNFLRIPFGQSVTIRLTNGDDTPINLRIAGLDGLFDTEDDAVTNPAQIGGGGVGELTFAPLAPGAYTFRSDFNPTKMGGQIVVGNATPGWVPTDTPQPSATKTGPLRPEAVVTELRRDHGERVEPSFPFRAS